MGEKRNWDEIDKPLTSHYSENQKCTRWLSCCYQHSLYGCQEASPHLIHNQENVSASELNKRHLMKSNQQGVCEVVTFRLRAASE